MIASIGVHAKKPTLFIYPAKPK